MSDEKSEKPKTAAELLAEREEAREKRAKAKAEVRAVQRLKDLDAVEAFEDENPDVSVQIIDVDAGPDLPTLVLVKCPEKKYHTRYLSRLKPKKDGKPVDAHAASEELASVSVAYPDAETYEANREKRSGIHIQVGVAASNLCSGRVHEEGKA